MCPMADPNKPGVQTTEFYLTLFATLIGAVLTSGLVLEDSQLMKILGVASIVLATLGYQYQRGQLKTAKVAANATIVASAVAPSSAPTLSVNMPGSGSGGGAGGTGGTGEVVVVAVPPGSRDGGFVDRFVLRCLAAIGALTIIVVAVGS